MARFGPPCTTSAGQPSLSSLKFSTNRAASEAYFGKHASDLSVEEAVELAAALPSPYERHPGKPPSGQIQRLREHYLERMRQAGFSTDEAGEEPSGKDD